MHSLQIGPVNTWLVRDMTCHSNAIKDRKFSGTWYVTMLLGGCWKIQPASTFMSWSRSKLLGRFEMLDVLDSYHGQKHFCGSFLMHFNFEKSSQVNECLLLLSSKRFYCCGFLADCIGCLASATNMFMMWKTLGTTLGSITTTSWAVLPQRPLSIFVFEAS